MITYNDATLDDIRADELAQDDLEGYTGRTWTTAELLAEFEVVGYAAPFVVVRRDGRLGTMEFRHYPRIYFSFQQA